MLMLSESKLRAALMLLLMTWRKSELCNGLTVDPPKDLFVRDLGHLGVLEVTWSPPDSLINMVECSIRYQLEYYNTYKKSWSAIRTTLRTFSTQFDLMKDIRVRVYTLLSGPCTNNTVVQSTNYTELIQNPPRTGVKDTEVQDFLCVFYNMEYMECKWRRSPKTPAGSQHNLYFWHKELEQAVECPKYLISAGVRSGCSFRGKSLPDFTDINFCINGSAPEGPLRPTFISLQIQNHVKCATTEKLDLQIGQDMQLELNWEHPDGRIPGHCLEWEVEHTKENPNGKTALIHPKQTSLTFPAFNDDERNCFRVRSKLHKYCADRSFWSDWSPPTCYPEKEVAVDREWDILPVYVCIALAIIAMLVLFLCIWAALRMNKSRQLKKVDSFLSSL